MILLPVFNQESAIFTYNITLDGIDIEFKYCWNSRNESWNISLFHENGDLKGLKAILNYPLLRQNKSIFPYLPGDLFIVNTSNKQDPDYNYDNFGMFYQPAYFSKEEVEAWEEENGL